MIELRNVSKQYGKVRILEDISFKIEPGQRLSLLGPGGCGKSTIIKIILGIEPPTSGEVYLFDEPVHQLRESEKRQLLRKVGVAFQQGALFDYMSVADNLKFAMQHMTEKTDAEMDEKIDSLLKAVKLPHTKDMFPFELSGGMQRRVGIARALATDPTVAFFDEPTAGLDPVTSTIILNMIDDLGGSSENTTLMVATSTVEIAIRFASRVVLINQGRVVADGDWQQLIVDGDDWVKHFLSVRLIGIDIHYARELGLPERFIKQHWH